MGINELKWAEFAFRNKFEYYPALHDANLTTEMWFSFNISTEGISSVVFRVKSSFCKIGVGHWKFDITRKGK